MKRHKLPIEKKLSEKSLGRDHISINIKGLYELEKNDLTQRKGIRQPNHPKLMNSHKTRKVFPKRRFPKL
jgi:hypothetical protein